MAGRTSWRYAVACALLCCSGDAAATEVVPRLAGQSIRVAKQLAGLANADLLVGAFYISEKAWRDELSADVIVMQTPQPRTTLHNDRVIAAWTFRRASPDQRIVRVPDLRGVPMTTAIDRLRANELIPMFSHRHAAQRENSLELHVDDHYPRQDQAVFVGTSVLISLSRAGGDTPRQSPPAK